MTRVSNNKRVAMGGARAIFHGAYFSIEFSGIDDGMGDGIYRHGALGLRLGGIDVAEAINSAKLPA